MTAPANPGPRPLPRTQEIRDRFETWATAHGLELDRETVNPDAYVFGEVDIAWKSWQAATADREARLARLEQALRDVLHDYDAEVGVPADESEQSPARRAAVAALRPLEAPADSPQ